MALTGAQYQSMRSKFRGVLSTPTDFVADGELDNFIGQLTIDVTGAVSTAQKNQADALLVGALTSPIYTPVAADVALFFAQAQSAVPAIIAALSAFRYQQLKNVLIGALSLAGVRTEAQMLAYMATYLVTGNFSAVFNNTGIIQYLRSDLGLGTTGSIVNTWADQSGNGWNVVEGTASVGIGNVTAGLNGHAGIVGGVGGQFGAIAALDLPAPATTPTFFWGVARLITSPGAGQGWLTSSAAAQMLLYANAGVNLTNFNAGAQSIAAVSLGSWGRFEAQFNNAASDYVKFAASTGTPGAAGNTDPTGGRYLFASNIGANLGNWELLTMLTLNRIPSGTELSNGAALAQSFYGVSVGI